MRFKRSDGQKDTDLEELSEERCKQLSDVAFDILHEFDAIPGLNSADTAPAQHMRLWTDQVRSAAAHVGRLEIAESKIGEALARAPVSEGEPWPPDHVCGVIEDFWSERLSTGFRCGCVNKLGIRWIGEGEPDRALAEQYAAWARYRQITHPRVCALLKELSEDFSSQAGRRALNAKLRRHLEV